VVWALVVAPVATAGRIISAYRLQLHLIAVFSNARGTVAIGSAVKRRLAGCQILVAAMLSLQRRILKRPPVGESDFPRLRARPMKKVI
jgi:hypothetical protein